MTQQPDWEEIGTRGDVNFVEYGGGLVFKDRTGVYEPELEYVEPPPDDSEQPKALWTVYRVVLDPEVPNWGDIEAVAQTHGQDPKELEAAFTSDDPMERAWAYEMWAGYYGWYELDQYPLELKCAEVNKRYDADVDCYGEIQSEIEKMVERMVDESAAQGESQVGDQLMIDLDNDGYDPQSVFNIAEFGDAIAVNEELTLAPSWAEELGIKSKAKVLIWSEIGTNELVRWLNDNGYERTDYGGRIPGTEGYAYGDHVIDAVAREMKIAKEDVVEAAKALDWWKDEIPGEASGRGTIWAKRKEGEGSDDEVDGGVDESRRRPRPSSRRRR